MKKVVIFSVISLSIITSATLLYLKNEKEKQSPDYIANTIMEKIASGELTAETIKDICTFQTSKNDDLKLKYRPYYHEYHGKYLTLPTDIKNYKLTKVENAKVDYFKSFDISEKNYTESYTGNFHSYDEFKVAMKKKYQDKNKYFVDDEKENVIIWSDGQLVGKFYEYSVATSYGLRYIGMELSHTEHTPWNLSIVYHSEQPFEPQKASK